MKRVLSLLLSAVMLAGAAVATYAAPPAISNSSDAKMYVDFEDGQNSIWTQGFSITGKDLEYQLRANPKKIYTATKKEEANNKYIELRRTGTTGDTDGYFDIYYYEPSDANRQSPWGVMNKCDAYNPVYNHVFMLSYDARFENNNDSLANWNVGSLRFNAGSNKFFTFSLKFNKDQVNVQPKDGAENGYVGETNKELSLNQWHNFTLIFNMLEENGYYTASLYIDDAYVGTVKTHVRAKDVVRTQTTFGFDWDTNNPKTNSVVSVDNVFFGVLPDNSILTADTIESIADAVKIDCTNENHEQTTAAEATTKLLPGTYTFETTSPTTALVTLNPANYADYYKLLGSDHAKKGSGDARTTISLEYKDGAWALAGDPAQLYVTCDAKAPVDYTVTYVDGCDGYAFATQTHTVTKEYNQPDPATPLFMGTPQRNGYQFLGWFPAVSETVTHDVVYTATWKEIVVFRPALGSATLTVTDTDGKPLAGAKFELHCVASNGTDTVVDTFTTDRNGAIKLYANPKTNTGLSPNSSYYWKQIEAPNGYKIAEETLSFAARYGSTAKLTLVNEKN